MAHHQTSEDQLRQWFNYVDADRSGYVDANELHRAMQAGGLNLDLGLCQRIVQFVDDDGNGRVDFREYAKLHMFLTKAQSSYWHFDQDRSGSLSFDEAYNAVRYTGYQLSQQTFQGIFDMFDHDRSRTISFAEYLSMSLYLESSMETYQMAVASGAAGGQSYDQMMQAAARQAAAEKAKYSKHSKPSGYPPAGSYPSGYPTAPAGYPAKPTAGSTATGYPAQSSGYPASSTSSYNQQAMTNYNQQKLKKKKSKLSSGVCMGLLAGGLLALAL